MDQRWTPQAVSELAPDASSRKAAEKLTTPAKWPTCGHRSAEDGAVAVVWGECRSSGSKNYQAAVHLQGPDAPAFRCSCPSRKFPCKHALALMSRWAQGTVEQAEQEPEWVSDWVNKRLARAAPKPEATPEQREKSAQQARRTAAAREGSVADGLQELQLWLGDQVGSGLAEAPAKQPSHWQHMAQRLTDAKAPGLARRVHQLDGLFIDADWPDELLAEFALLRLAAVAHQAGDALPAKVRSAARERIGFSHSGEEVLADGERCADTWLVLGRKDLPSGPDKIAMRRVWLRGAESGRIAQYLSFAAPGQGLDGRFPPGTALRGELAFYPNGYRALPAAELTSAPATVAAGGTIGEALHDCSARLAEDPWLEAWPLVISSAQVGGHGEALMLLDDTGYGLPLVAEPWLLLALSGNAPTTVVAEWTPWGLDPVTAWNDYAEAVSL